MLVKVGTNCGPMMLLLKWYSFRKVAFWPGMICWTLGGILLGNGMDIIRKEGQDWRPALC